MRRHGHKVYCGSRFRAVYFVGGCSKAVEIDDLAGVELGVSFIAHLDRGESLDPSANTENRSPEWADSP
jgi:hypothetical protein